MLETTATVDELGRIVLRKEIRTELDIKESDVLNLCVVDDKIIIKKSVPDCIFCGAVKNLVLKNYKYILNKFYLERIIYDIEHNGIISVKNKENIYKNKYNYINGIKEEYYLKKFDYLNIEW